MNANNIRIIPIGRVRNEFEFEIPKGYEDSLTEIIINEDLIEGLHKLEENSHILVVFWMHRVKDEDRNIMKMHPKGREDLHFWASLPREVLEGPIPWVSGRFGSLKKRIIY